MFYGRLKGGRRGRRRKLLYFSFCAFLGVKMAVDGVVGGVLDGVFTSTKTG